MSEPVSVIVSVYNNSEVLQRTLWGLAEQRFTDFRLILADDGSNQAEIDQIQSYVTELGLSATHIWHEDRGFRKSAILNQAIAIAQSERLIFIDADIIPRNDFVANHYRLLRPGYFIAGGSHLNLPLAIQSDISRAHIQSGQLFTLDYLQHHDIDKCKFRLRLEKRGIKARAFDTLFPRSNAFIGCNASCWRKDALEINGFDERWGYGGMDIEFGMRMTNLGIKSRRHSFSLVALHQDHKRPYRDLNQIKRNKEALKQLEKSNITKIQSGINGYIRDKIKTLYST